MTTATSLVSAFFRDASIAKRLLTPGRLEQSQAIVAHIRANTDVLAMVKDVNDPSVVRVILNTLFGTMSNEVEQHGGVVLSLTEQDMILAFLIQSQSQAGRVHAALVALENALATAQEKTIPGYPTIQWEVSAGVGIGVLNLAVFHNQVTDRRLLLYDSPALAQADDALRLAQPGQIVVHREVLKRLGSPPVGQWIKAQYFLPQDSFTHSAVAQVVETQASAVPVNSNIDIAAQKLHSLVDSYIREHLSDFESGLLSEDFVVLHIRFYGIAALREDNLDQWQTITDRILSTAERYGGIIVQSQKTGFEIAFCNEPSLERLAPRSVSCALAIKRALQAMEFDVRMSLSAGKTFMGLVGTQQSQHFLLIGQSIRQAKALLDLSDEYDIVVPPEIRAVTQQEFSWRPSPDEAIYTLTGEVMLGSGLVTRIQSRTQSTLIDREAQIEKIQKLVAKAHEGKEHLLLIKGAGGCGRSALIDVLIENWLEDDGNGFLSIGPSYTPSSPYSLWIPIWQALFGLMPEANAAQNYEALETAISRLLPDFKNLTPIYADIFGLVENVPNIVSGLSARVRQERLLEANAKLLRYLSDLTPILLVFEYVDYADALSLDLIARLPQWLGESPVLLCLEDRGNPAHSLSSRFEEAEVIEAQPLNSRHAWRLFKRLLPDVQWPYSYQKALEDRLGTVEKSRQVSPRYVVALSRSIKNGVLKDDGKFDENYPPQNWPRTEVDAVQLLFSAAISPEARQVAMRAAVAGMLFYHQWPWLEGNQIALEIEQLRNLHLVEPFIDMGHTQRWDHFSSNSVREAIYEYLDISTRLHLHRQVSEWYEKLSPGRAGQGYIAFQLQQGGRFIPAIRAHLKASAHAAEWGAHSEASQHLLAAERLAVQRESQAAERCQILLSWGQMRLREGNYERALHNIEEAHALSEKLNDTELTGEILVLRAQLKYYLGQFEKAIDDASVAAKLTVKNKAVTARALWIQSLVFFEQGKRRQASRTLMHALNLDAVDNLAMLIEMELDATRIMLADYQRDAARTYIMRAQVQARELADSILMHRVLKTLGHIHLLYGEAEASIESLEEALGLPPPESTSIADLGDILLDYAVAQCYLGRYDDADISFETALSYYMGEEDFEARERTLNALRAAELYIDQGRHTEAQMTLDGLKPYREEMHEHINMLLSLAQVDIWLQEANFDDARELLDQLAAAETTGVTQWFMPLRYVREADFALLQGDFEKAEALAVQALGAVSLQGDLRALTLTYCLIAEAKILQEERPADIQDALERAVRNGRKQGRRLYLARALYLLGYYLRHTSIRGSTRARSNSYLFEANMLFQEMNLADQAKLPEYLRDYWQDDDEIPST